MAGKSADHTGHRKRMREKYLKYGIDIFEQHEILEMLLYSAVPRKNTNEMAHRLLNEFGSLSAVLDAPYERLLEADLTENCAIFLKFIPDFMNVYLNDKLNNNDRVVKAEELPQRLINKFLGKDSEAAYLLLMDPKYKELYFDVISKGTKTNTEFSITKICETAVHYSARYAVVAHNHPSGDTMPSVNDITATINLYQALRPLRITLLDHYIIADKDYLSFRESGIMFGTKEEFYESDFYKLFFSR